MKTNIELMTAELHKAFNIINKDFFEGKLPLPAITIQSSGKRSLSMGWCTTKEVWHDKEGSIKLYEINLSAEYINLSFVETMDTLMHEMVHLYNLVHNIQDVSRNGTYHNKKFLERALKSGFIYPYDKPDPKYGFSYVKLAPQTIAILNELPIKKEVFCIARKKPHEIAQIQYDENSSEIKELKSTTNSFRWVCPSCDLIIRSSKPDIYVICGACNKVLINVQKGNVTKQ